MEDELCRGRQPQPVAVDTIVHSRCWGSLVLGSAHTLTPTGLQGGPLLALPSGQGSPGLPPLRAYPPCPSAEQMDDECMKQ